MEKCKFSDVWLDDPRFKDWLRPVVGNNREAFCHASKKTINILCMRLNAVKSHMESANHQRRMHRRGEQLPISMFCGTSPTSTATALPSTALPTRTTASSFPNDSIVNRCSDARQQQTQCPVTTAATLRAERRRLCPFNPLRQRLDVFLHSKLHKSHPDLLRFCLSVLLSHGQATVERGFSVNKEVESCNLLDDSLEALKLVCDEVIACSGILKVPLTKELLASAASARSQYRLYLDNERKRRRVAHKS
ncbi:hypothetical protein MHYP_G00152790 [Metynnis hypsauchen]